MSISMLYFHNNKQMFQGSRNNGTCVCKDVLIIIYMKNDNWLKVTLNFSLFYGLVISPLCFFILF